MSNDLLEIDEPTTEAELHAALGRLFRAARGNDVDVLGGWTVEPDDDGHSYLGVEVTEAVLDDSRPAPRRPRE